MDSVCLVVSWVREVDEVGDVVCVVYLCDDEVLVESSVDVAVSGVDLVSVDEGRCQFLKSGVCDGRWHKGEEDLGGCSAGDESSVGDAFVGQSFPVEQVDVDVVWQWEVDLAGFLSSVVVCGGLDVECLLR